MAYPYIDSWKHITVTMKDRTNAGMTSVRPGDAFNALKNDKRFYPIGLDDKGLGKVVKADATTKSFIGVLLESYNKAGVTHMVMVHGIVPMKAKANTKPGVVYLDTVEGQITSTKPASNIVPVGYALESSSTTEVEYISVFIGMF